MKNYIFLFLIFTLFSFAKCKKDKTNKPSEQLPPITQDGRNTLGFLFNGEPWTPKGFNGSSNLSIDYDPDLNNGVLGISAYRIINDTTREYFKLGVKDSLNFFTPTFSLNLTNTALFRAYFSDKKCTYFSTDTTTVVNGNLTISKIDKTNRIIAGTFSINFFKPGCVTVNIKEGRFDIKF